MNQDALLCTLPLLASSLISLTPSIQRCAAKVQEEAWHKVQGRATHTPISARIVRSGLCGFTGRVSFTCRSVSPTTTNL